MNTFELLKPRPGLRVFISGAASGIGAAIAEAFLQVDAKVYIFDVNPAAVAQAKEQYPRLHVGVADVAHRAQVDSVIDDAALRHSGGAAIDQMVEALVMTYWSAKTECLEVTRALSRSVAELDNEPDAPTGSICSQRL